MCLDPLQFSEFGPLTFEGADIMPTVYAGVINRISFRFKREDIQKDNQNQDNG